MQVKFKNYEIYHDVKNSNDSILKFGAILCLLAIFN
jgi:hypothetical protein